MSLAIRRAVRCISILLFLVFSAQVAHGQDSTSALTGVVTDPSGAAVPNARVVAIPTSGQPVNARTNANGYYEFKTLAPGVYTVRAVAKGFQPFAKPGITIEAGKPASVNMQLEIAVQEEKVEVQDSGTQLDVSGAGNASSVVLKGKDLDALSDDPDELSEELQALAGPSAGPNGGQIYIDGFTGGQLPPKSSIREVRINQNPFSAEYDHLGFGRIEVFTKPGTDKCHGQFMVNGNAAGLNARNPFLNAFNSPGQPEQTQPPYHTIFVLGNITGPLAEDASFTLSGSHRSIQDNSLVSATILNPTNLGDTTLTCPVGQITCNYSVANPASQSRTEINP